MNPSAKPRSSRSATHGDQTELLAEVAHELKNQINVLQGYSEVLALERYGPHSHPKYSEYSKIVHRESSKMLRICENLILDGSPDVSEKQEKLRTSAEEAINRTIELYSLMARKRGVSLKTEIDPAFPVLNVDKDVLESVLDNLVSNAIKFTPRGGSVTLRAKLERGGAVILVISDTGVGLDSSDRITDVTKPSSSRGVHGDTGSGLGLGIVRRELERCGAKLVLRRKSAPGTEWVVRFPPDLIVAR